MIHPNTELRFVNHQKGRGVFATSFIPKGTITYVKDSLEVEIPPADPRLSDPNYKDLIETYSYIDGDGTRVISWDHAKYVNHCCRCNTMSTGYGFEIAITNIAADEEITDEYGMFNISGVMELSCEKSPCRKLVSSEDLERFYPEWDEIVQQALNDYMKEEQPLELFLSPAILEQLQDYLRTGSNYRSVLELKYRKSY
ncbi:MAG: SET domain-containing protein [Balneolaceae bacterium]